MSGKAAHRAGRPTDGRAKELRRQGVSAVVTLYASRDLRGPEREAVLAVKAER